ncbi:hypothetical protein NDU88_002344 [Pleurodeles waltl]|uniref:Uncharacterized protein n=1 Tax=Pleurodeles waltl TaxID=8319 RepID=A0AAV7MNH3_PLEWA|nr:hypothetical protein NDU88_002344 [Pleurodeles waltl]
MDDSSKLWLALGSQVLCRDDVGEQENKFQWMGDTLDDEVPQNFGTDEYVNGIDKEVVTTEMTERTFDENGVVIDNVMGTRVRDEDGVDGEDGADNGANDDQTVLSKRKRSHHHGSKIIL